jgi:Tfp pilus assembly protein PilF
VQAYQGVVRRYEARWGVAGLASAVVLAIAIGAAFFLFQPTPSQQIASTAPSQPAPVLQPPAPADPPAVDVSAPGAEAEMAAVQVADAPDAMDSTPVDAQAETVEDSPPVSVETEVAAAPAAAAPPPPEAAEREPMPQLAADSPARMLSPPVTINRGDFALAGVGDAVQVRNVSQQAQNNAGAGYSALIRGEYDTALGFYDQALQQEPNSALALLGRGAALQKIGRSSEAQGAYDAVLRLDPKNREALTNLTVIISERAPNEALARLVDLERQHPNFSPITAQIGLTHAKMGAMPQARDYLRRAVSLTPGAVMYHYNLALVLDHMALSDQAVRSYENVLTAMAGGSRAVGLSPVVIEQRVRYLRAR